MIVTQYYNTNGNRIRKETHHRHIEISQSNTDLLVAIIEHGRSVFSISFGKKYSRINPAKFKEIAKTTLYMVKASALTGGVNLKPKPLNGEYDKSGKPVFNDTHLKYKVVINRANPANPERAVSFTLATRDDVSMRWSNQITGSANPYHYRGNTAFLQYLGRIYNAVQSAL